MNTLTLSATPRDSPTGAPARIWLIVVTQWLTSLVSIVLASQRWPTVTEAGFYWSLMTVGILGSAALVTWRLLGNRGWEKPLHPVQVGTLAAFSVAVVSATNWWQSPFVFILLNAVVLAAYTVGMVMTASVAIFAILVISVPYILFGGPLTGMSDQTRLRDSLTWSMLIAFIAATTGYAVRLNEREVSLATERARDEGLDRLLVVNRLLTELHGEAQHLPMSLDEEDIAASAFQQMSSLFEFDYAVLLVREEGVHTEGRGDQWAVMRSVGRPPLSSPCVLDDLPGPLRNAIERNEVTYEGSLVGPQMTGVHPRSSSGMYAPLVARGVVIGGIAVESRSEQGFSKEESQVFGGFVNSLALAVDNARWFARLRAVGADEERNRIARDLHDSLGQSLAYLSYSADNIIDQYEANKPVEEQVRIFRDEVRTVIGEMRDTLYDLRTDVGQDKGFVEVVSEYAERVSERAEFSIEFNHMEKQRLSLLPEKEMWRIAQEAIVNAERHSGCSKVEVNWFCDGKVADLEIADNGNGFSPGTAGRLDSYGILGMKERALAIGATLDVTSSPQQGCRVHCRLTTKG